MAKSYVVQGTKADFSKNLIVDEKFVLVKITDWDFKKDENQTIIVDLLIMSGTRKGISLKDYVTFDPNDKMNWKYAALRDAIGQPIPAAGVDSFDLLELVNRKLAVNLVKSKDGKYQNVSYIPYEEKLVEGLIETNPDDEQPTKPNPNEPVPEPSETKPVTKGLDPKSVVDDDLPF